MRTVSKGPAREETSPSTNSTVTPREEAFSPATLTAPGSRSIPTARSAPISLAPMQNIPFPQPRSATDLPCMSPAEKASQRMSAATAAGVSYCSSLAERLSRGLSFCRAISSLFLLIWVCGN